MSFQITKEQRDNINKLKMKKVIRNSCNRDIMLRNYNNNLLLSFRGMIGSLMQNQIYQTNMMQQAIQNLTVATDGLKKKVNKAKKEVEENEEI